MAINVTSLTTTGQVPANTTTPTIYSGNSLTFNISASATGGVTISYEWQISTTNGVVWDILPNNGLSSITVSNIPSSYNGALIRCKLTANSGSGGAQEIVYSDSATPNGHALTLVVITSPEIFVIDSNSASYNLNAGSSLTLTIDATTNSTLTQFTPQNQANIDTELVIQWQISTDGGSNWNNVTPTANLVVGTPLILGFGTTPETYYKRSTLTLSNITTAQSGYRYRTRITYTKDGVTASNSPLDTTGSIINVNAVISITKQPGVAPDTTSVVSYNSTIPNSGEATFTITASTTAGTSLNYQWSYTLNNGLSYINLTNNPQSGLPPLELAAGTLPTSPTLQISKLSISNPSYSNIYSYGFRCVVTGSSGEVAVTSNTAYVTMTQQATGLLFDPGDATAIEDRYGNIPNRSSYLEFIQTATFSAAVNINGPDGISSGQITLQWQRKYASETGFSNVGPPKVTFGNPSPVSATNPTTGTYSYETPPLRRDLDNQSQYRMAVTYQTGSAGVATIYTSAATLTVYRTAYIDNNPAFSSVYNNQNATFVVTASPSSGTNISYQWEHSPNNLNWYTLTNTPAISISSMTRTNYIVTVTCATAHGFAAGDIVYVSGSSELAYNGRATVSATGLTSTQFQFTAKSIPSVSPAPGILTVSPAPQYSGVTTDTLIVTPVVETITRRFFRCIVTVPDSLASVISASGFLTILDDSFYQISSLNDIYVFQFNTIDWSVTANSLSLQAPSYQWQYNPSSAAVTSTAWVDISGANTASYSIANVQPANAGFYRCRVTSFGGTVSRSNAAKLTVFPVSLTISTNIASAITVLEGSLTNSLTVAATATNGSIVQYFWEVKPPGATAFQALPAGYNQTSNAFPTYNLPPFSRTVDNGSIIRCRMNAADVPGFTYSNQCTITVDRRFYYFADAATKTIPAGQQVTFDLQPSWTGDELPTYQWQTRPNSSAAWVPVSGETNPTYTILAANVVAALNNSQVRCVVTFNQVTTFQYYRTSNYIDPITPPGTATPTAVITLSIVSAVPNISYYSKQRQKVGAAIGTVICVPKPGGYVHNPAANVDDASLWKVALTGQTLAGAPALGVSASTAPYGPNDRFPGFIEMRGQILKARDFPELARIMGTQYGGTITGTYPTYAVNDTFRMPCPYGMKLMGTGNVNNNLSSPSVVPYYAANSTPGGAITDAGSMGGVYNFEKLPQLPPGSPGLGGVDDGTSTDTFTIGTHRTDGWTNCTNTANTNFIGQFTWQVSDSSGIGSRNLGSGPPHSHVFNSIRATGQNAGAGGGGSAAKYNNGDSGNVLEGPEGVAGLGRSHKHGISFTQGATTYTPPAGGGSGGTAPAGDVSYSSPGTYSFTLPINVTGFTYNIKSGAGGAGGVDFPNPGGPGGQAASATGSLKDIPSGTEIEIKIGAGGGGGFGCAGNAPGGGGGNSGGTGFGGGPGGNSGPGGCSGSGGGGGGASFMYVKQLGSGPNPQGLQVGTILVIVGGGGGGGGGGHHGGSTKPNYPGANGGSSWSASAINSASFYTNQAALQFTPWSSSTTQSGKPGQNKSGDGGGAGAGGGGWTGGAGGTNPGGDSNSNGGGGGTSAYRSANHNGTPTVGTGGGGGSSSASSGTSGSGSGGSIVISYAGATTTPPATPGGISNPNHAEGIGSEGTAYLSQTVDLHNDATSTAPSMGLTMTSGEAAMSTASRTIWDSALSFYLRNNEVLPMVQPYFRLKYMIKAF